MIMQSQFCNECGLSYDIPHLVAERLLGVEYLHRIENRYKQMRNGYDYPYTEWQKVFTEDLKPFNGYSDTTSVTIPLGNTQLGSDIKALHQYSKQYAYNDCRTRPVKEQQMVWRML